MLLSDIEHRIFLSAMEYEKEICDFLDKTLPTSDIHLSSICESIIRKVREAEPVRHGHWLHEMNDCYWNKWTCSNCGYHKTTDTHVSLDWKYCPNCGAKMDEEVSK